MSIFSKLIASLCDLLKLAKYLFENSAQDFSLNAMAPSPLAWVGEIPYVSTNGRRERGPIRIRIAWWKNGRGHYSFLCYFSPCRLGGGKRPAVVAGEIGTNRELDFKQRESGLTYLKFL